MNTANRNKNFIDRDKLYSLLDEKTPTESELNNVLNKALKLKGLSLQDVALLLKIEKKNDIQKIMDVAHRVKHKTTTYIYTNINTQSLHQQLNIFNLNQVKYFD